MAEGKKSIVIYADWMKKFDALSDEEAGRLIKHFFMYVNDMNPIPVDRITELSFIDIEQTLKRDLKKWEQRAERSRNNGKNGGRPSINNNPEKPRKTQQVISKPRKPDSVIDNVSDSVIDNDILLKKETKNKFSFSNSLISIGADKNLVDDWLKVRKNKRLTNTETAFKGFVSELYKSGKEINFVLKECVLNSWGGFKSDWIKNKFEKSKINPNVNPVI